MKCRETVWRRRAERIDCFGQFSGLTAFNTQKSFPIRAIRGDPRQKYGHRRNADQALHRGVAKRVSQEVPPVITHYKQLRTCARSSLLQNPVDIAHDDVAARRNSLVSTGSILPQVLLRSV